ncbi:MAG: ABC transporter substrate-binding protein [Anaerolineae bacterium]
MRNNRSLLTLFSLVILALIAGCGPGPAAEATSAPTQMAPTQIPIGGPITLWARYVSDDFSSRMAEWMEEFTADYPDAEVTLEILHDHELAEFVCSAGELPGVLLVPAEYLACLDARDLLNTELPASIVGEMNEGAFYTVMEADTTLADGTVLGIPYYGAVQGIWYRADLFEEAGLAPPTTPEAILAAAEALYDPDASQYGIVLPTTLEQDSLLMHHALTNLAQATGAQPISEDGAIDFTDPAFVDAMQLYEDLMQYGPPSGTMMREARDLFLNQQAAMILDSTALPQALADRTTDVKRDELARVMAYASAINPTEDGSTTYAYTLALAVGSASDENSARALIAYLMDDAYNVYWIPSGWAPAQRGYAMQWRSLKAHDWFGYYEGGMPEDLLDGLRKSVRWNHASDEAAVAFSRVYAARLFPLAVDQLVNGLDGQGAAEWLQSEAGALP